MIQALEADEALACLFRRILTEGHFVRWGRYPDGRAYLTIDKTTTVTADELATLDRTVPARAAV